VSRPRRFINELLGERIIYGGCVATRKEVYQDCIDRGLPARAADRFAFSPRAIQDGEPVPALTLADVREFEKRKP